jgi:serine/threonine protein kinase
MINLPFTNDAGAGPRHRHRPSCKLNGGPVPSCICPRCTAKNLVQDSKTSVDTRAKPWFRRSNLSIIYWRFQECVAIISKFLYKGKNLLMRQAGGLQAEIVAAVRRTFAFAGSHTATTEKLPSSSSDTTFGLSIQYLVLDIIQHRSFTHLIFHKLWLCNCRGLNEVAKLSSVNFPLIHYEGDYGDFDRFGSVERAIVAKKMLPPGGEAPSCVIMQHIHTKRPRKFYVFKTITRDKSLISHSDHRIMSNEAYILLGKLKTNLYPHLNIVQMFNCVTSNAVAGIPIHILQMEYCDGGDLWDLNNRCIKQGFRLPKALVTHVFVSPSAALAYLHHGLILTSSSTLERKYLPSAIHNWQPILHNDIKPENILLRWPSTSSSSVSTYPDIVLADFGAAGVESHVKGPRGTYKYAAPEVREAHNAPTSLINRFHFAAAGGVKNNVVLTTKSDIWGLGAVMKFLLFEYEKERGGKEWDSKGKVSQWQDMEAVHGESMVKWVRRCLEYRPLGRPSARTLLGTAVREVKGEAGVEEEVQRLPEWLCDRDCDRTS